MDLKFFFKKKVSTKENQAKNQSEIDVDSDYSLEKQNIHKFNKNRDKDWKKASTDRENEVYKEKEYKRNLNYCNICSSKLKFIRYNPKPEWKMEGQLCRRCWDIKNNDYKSKHLKSN